MSEPNQIQSLMTYMYLLRQQIDQLTKVTCPSNPSENISRLRKTTLKVISEVGSHPFCDEVLEELDQMEILVKEFFE